MAAMFIKVRNTQKPPKTSEQSKLSTDRKTTKIEYGILAKRLLFIKKKKKKMR